MASSRVELSSTIRALMAADKPLLGGLYANAIRGLSSTAIQWRVTGSFASGADATDSAFPTSLLYDGKTTAQTQPTGGSTANYVIIDAGANISFDYLAILRHNFGDIGGLAVSVEIADNNAFSTNLYEIASWTPTTQTRRLTEFALDHTGSSAYTYSARYIRIKMTKASSFTPAIGEFVLGTRRQLKHHPEIPYDDKRRHTEAVDLVSYSGATTRMVKYKGQRLLQCALKVSESAYVSDLDALWTTDTDYGTYPFLWVDRPSTEPHKAYTMLGQPERIGTLVGYAARSYEFVASEQGPTFVDAET